MRKFAVILYPDFSLQEDYLSDLCPDGLVRRDH